MRFGDFPGLPPRDPGPVGHAPSGGEILSEQGRMMFVVGIGVVGGLAIGKMAFEHMFKEGLEDKERRNMILFGAGAFVTYAVAHLFDIDKKYWDVGAAVEAAAAEVMK